jgi:hypothetical protein
LKSKKGEIAIPPKPMDVLCIKIRLPEVFFTGIIFLVEV